MRNVTVTKTIRVNLRADEWGLYDDDEDAGEAYRDMAAYIISCTAEQAINNSETRTEARKKIEAILEANRRVGANDTEPRSVMRDLLNLVFTNGETK